MIEILVTLVIIAFGLLGLAGLQTQLQSSEMESYQRSQALLLLNDMANRIATNRGSAGTYVAGATVANPLGAGMTCPTTTASPAQTDLGEWCNALQGAGETTTSGANRLGVMLGGRGCVEAVGSDYLVTVAWQGLTPLSIATDAALCGGGTTYDGASGSLCQENRCRRAVTTLVRIADLSNP